LRALVAPLLLIATVVLSFLATLGVCALEFTHLFGARADSSFPLFTFVFLVALGIDYTSWDSRWPLVSFWTRCSCGRCWCRRCRTTSAGGSGGRCRLGRDDAGEVEPERRPAAVD